MIFGKSIKRRVVNNIVLRIGAEGNDDFFVPDGQGTDIESVNHTYICVGMACVWDKIELRPDGSVSIICYPKPEAAAQKKINQEMVK